MGGLKLKFLCVFFLAYVHNDRFQTYIDMRSIIKIMGEYLENMKSFAGYESVL